MAAAAAAGAEHIFWLGIEEEMVRCGGDGGGVYGCEILLNNSFGKDLWRVLRIGEVVDEEIESVCMRVTSCGTRSSLPSNPNHK